MPRRACSALHVRFHRAGRCPAGRERLGARADIHITRQLREAAKVIDIDLIDHVIVGGAKADPLKVGLLFLPRCGPRVRPFFGQYPQIRRGSIVGSRSRLVMVTPHGPAGPEATGAVLFRPSTALREPCLH